MSVGSKKGRQGLFITFEGIDGCGKSTQLRLAARFLKEHGVRADVLREPGSTKVGERIRRLLLDTRIDMTELTELLLYEAARSELVVREIEPKLKAGAVVLCDRFYDSTTAYQGYGRQLDIAMVKRLHKIAVGTVVPHLTFVFDLPLKLALQRRGSSPDRLESQSLAFHRRVAAGFRSIAAAEPRRVKLIDARPEPAAVFTRIQPFLERKVRSR